VTAEERHILLFGVRSLLLDAARVFARRPEWLGQAASIVASIDAGQLCQRSVHATELYCKAAALRHPLGPPRVPKAARGQYPFDAPTALLRDIQPAIEALLAPLTDRRARAAGQPRRRKQDTNDDAGT